MPDITSVTVGFSHGVKREEYGPVKKAEVSITAAVAEGEMGETVLALVSTMAMTKVAEMLDAPKPVIATGSQEGAEYGRVHTDGSRSGGQPPAGEAPARRSRAKKAEPATTAAEPTADAAEVSPPATGTESASESGEQNTADQPEAEDEWAAGAADIEITDQELLAATSKRAGELGAREPIVKLIATFATRTEGAPFKVQEIPQPQRKDYLTKLAALTA